jgi:Na+/H+-translocating membrane pyrophosphatase
MMKIATFESGAVAESGTVISRSSTPQMFRPRYAPPMENNPIRQMQQTKAHMRQIIDNLHEDVGNVTEAKAKGLFETSVEVLTRLVKAFDDYESKFKRRGELNSSRRS